MRIFSLVAIVLLLSGCPNGGSDSAAPMHMEGQPTKHCMILGKFEKPVVVYVERAYALDGTEMHFVIEEELNKINSNTDLNFIISTSPTSANIRIKSIYSPAWDAKSASSAEPDFRCSTHVAGSKSVSGAQNPISYTELKSSGRKIESAVVYLNHFVWYTGNNMGEAYRDRYRSMVRHEFGHAIGLWHNTYDPSGIMAPSISTSNVFQVYSKEELAILNWLY